MKGTDQQIKEKIDRALAKYAKKGKYPAADNSWWKNYADEIFMRQFRGKPCMKCGHTYSVLCGEQHSSVGHHLIPKGKCKMHRYTLKNIAVLCPWHHLHDKHCSPHYQFSAMANHNFWLEVEHRNPEQYAWVKAHENDVPEEVFPLGKCFSYRSAFIFFYHKKYNELPIMKERFIDAARFFQKFFSTGEI